MSTYVFIQSRDPFGSREADFLEETAIAAKERGHDNVASLLEDFEKIAAAPLAPPAPNPFAQSQTPPTVSLSASVAVNTDHKAT